MKQVEVHPNIVNKHITPIVLPVPSRILVQNIENVLNKNVQGMWFIWFSFVGFMCGSSLYPLLYPLTLSSNSSTAASRSPESASVQHTEPQISLQPCASGT